MFPLKDNIPSRSLPVVNFAVIAVSTLVFLGQVFYGDGQSLVEQFGMIPARVVEPDREIMIEEREVVRTPIGLREVVQERPAAESPVPAWLTLFTCIFLHGGWLHFLGNMWFLYIFGDNVEDRYGHLGYAAFYVGCGVAASFAHLVTNLSSTIPTIGASGAIAGVMGGYFLLYPHARILALVPVFFFLHILVVPAALFLGIWIVLQFLQGTFAVWDVAAGGVAWWAHVGGFVVGLVATGLLYLVGLLRPPPGPPLPNSERPFHHYRYR